MYFRLLTITVAACIVAAGCGRGDGTSADAIPAPAEAADVTQPVPSPAPSTTELVTTTTTVAPATVSTEAPPTSTAPPALAAPPPTTPPPPPPPVTAPPAPPLTTPPPPAATGKACIVSLHGKGGGGQPEWTGSDGVRHSFPAGNAAGWGGRQWLYYPEGNYQATRNIVGNDVAAGGCGRVVVYGFSNGAAFAAKLYCRGETFGGTVVGYIIDDPVVDHGVDGCTRPALRVVLYWTGGIDVPDGWACGDWTCEGGSTIGIARYQAAIGIVRTPSIHRTHQQYVDPPEFHRWL